MKTPHKLTPEEQELADKYLAAADIVDVLDKELYDLFMKGVRPLLDAGEFDKAKSYIAFMPDGVSRMYVMDAIRMARGDYDK
jgi:hypothetical protein